MLDIPVSLKHLIQGKFSRLNPINDIFNKQILVKFKVESAEATPKEPVKIGKLGKIEFTKVKFQASFFNYTNYGTLEC